jgi:hypothetical protein
MSAVNQKISLFIPHIFANLSKDLVIEVLEDDYNLGKISHIDFVEKTGADGKSYNAAYVHFEYWNEDMETLQFQQEVMNSEKGYRVVYDSPWFWIVLENKKKPRQIAGYRKPRLDLSETSSEETADPYPGRYIPGYNPTTDTTNYRLAFPELSNKPWVPEKSLQELIQEQVKEDLVEEWEECDYDYTKEDYEHMDEIEDEIDSQLVSIDGRYVKSLEEELTQLKMSFQQALYDNQRLHTAFHAETSKSQALAKALIILDSV